MSNILSRSARGKVKNLPQVLAIDLLALTGPEDAKVPPTITRQLEELQSIVHLVFLAHVDFRQAVELIGIPGEITLVSPDQQVIADWPSSQYSLDGEEPLHHLMSRFEANSCVLIGSKFAYLFSNVLRELRHEDNFDTLLIQCAYKGLALTFWQKVMRFLHLKITITYEQIEQLLGEIIEAGEAGNE